MVKRVSFFLSLFLVLSLFSYSESQENIMQNVMSINTEYQELMMKEAEKVQEFTLEKAALEKELVVLKEKLANKDKILAKLDKDAQIRWHRDKYKKLLKDYKKYYKKLDERIKTTEQKIVELTKLLNVMK